jgi:cation:H+ antiporter
VDYLTLAGGLIYLLMGGDLLVRGSVSLARRWHLSPMLVGVTIVAIGTSAPELFVSVQAALSDHPGIALGNIVGSNISNVLFVAGVVALIRPLAVGQERKRRDTVAMVASGLMLVGMAWNGHITRGEGLILLGGLAAFLVVKIFEVRGRNPTTPPDVEPPDFVLGLPSGDLMIALFIVVGVVWLPLGAKLLVDSAAAIAGQIGISEAVIGLTVIALGTSLPELAASAIAARRDQIGVALGNLIGSNVLNIFAIMGAAAFLSPRPIPVAASFLRLDLPVMIGATLVTAWFVLARRPVSRRVGVALVTAYVTYVATLVLLS